MGRIVKATCPKCSGFMHTVHYRDPFMYVHTCFVCQRVAVVGKDVWVSDMFKPVKRW